MFKSSVKQCVERAMESCDKSDGFTKDELSEIITDSIYNTITSIDFMHHVEKELDKLARRSQRTRL